MSDTDKKAGFFEACDDEGFTVTFCLWQEACVSIRDGIGGDTVVVTVTMLRELLRRIDAGELVP